MGSGLLLANFESYLFKGQAEVSFFFSQALVLVCILQ